MFVKAKALYRLVVKVLVVLMVIQGWPLLELSQAYKWELRDFKEFSFVTDLFGVREACAASPVANAGVDQSVSKSQPVGGSVALYGLDSYDPDDDPLTYQWYSPFATTFGPASLVPIPEGVYSVSLTVDDGASRSEIDTAVITVSPCFNISSRPKSGKVQLTWTHQDGTERYDVYRSNESDPFSFEKIGETTSTYSTYLDDAVLNETTYLYVVGAYSGSAWCYSDVISSHPTASRSRANYAPLIHSSPITHGTTGIIYNYDVNAADPNGDALSYSLLACPVDMDIDPDTGLILWIPGETGLFDVTVGITDGNGGADTQTFTIVVEDITSPNRSPVANAGTDQTAFVTETVQLDGSGSSDLDGDALTYEWSFVSVPAGSTAGLSDPTVVDPIFSINLPGTYVVQLIVNDGTVDSGPDTVTISTENSAPVADAGTDQTVFVMEIVQLIGSGSTDVDGDLLSFTWSFVSVPDGSTVSLSDPSFVEPTFVVDVAGSYVVQLIVNDGVLDSDPDTVTISTENRKPVADAGTDQTVFVGDTITLDGSGSSDVDGDLLTFMWSFTSMPDGSMAALSDPTAVNPGFDIDEPGIYVVQLIVNDGVLDSDPDTVTISTENRKPVAYAGTDQTVFVTEMVTLDGSGSSDVDGDLLTFMWSFTSMPDGSMAALSDPTAVNPGFDIDEPGIYVVQLIVNDGVLDSDPDTVTISTENRRPLADAGPNQTVFVTEIVTLDGSGSSDVDGDPLSYEWSFTSIPSGSAATLSDTTDVNPTFVVDMPGTYAVQLVVNDGLVDSEPATVTITTENSPPVADAGTDQTVFVTDTVQLNGGGSSDVDGNSLIYQWSFTSVPAGSTATLSDPTLVNPTFVVDVPGTYTIQLIVNDGTVDSIPDSVVISTGNSRPVANAGPDQTAFVTDTVQLDGSGSSDVDGDSLTCQWSVTSVPAGSTAILSDPTLVNPGFAVDLPGTYVVQLIVNDGTVDSDPDSVTITTENSPPVADAGPDQTAFVDNTVILDGSGSSDVDGDLLIFNWSFTSIPDGSTATLSDPEAVNPTFVIDEPGTYVVQLIVNDGTVNSNPDSVTITTENSPPVADAGPDQTVFVTETVQLNGSGSGDADGDSLTFMWSFISRPVGSTATLSDSTIANPTFAADLFGTYTVQLIVNDGTVNSDPDSVVISTQNSRPVAGAGSDQTVSIGDTVILDGNASSDVDGDPLIYQWSFTSIPAGSGATLSDTAAINPSFEADLPGTYVVQLIVNDGELDSAPDTIVITTENRQPVANAGTDQTVNEGETVQLEGGLSSDPDGDPLTYSWSFTSIPDGSTAALSNSEIAAPTFVADLAGAYIAQLIVNDGTLDSDSDTVNITAEHVNVPPAITSAPVTTATEDQLYTYDVEAEDPDIGDVLTFSLDASPAGMTIDTTTGLVQWTPTSSQVGDNDVTVRVEDTGGLFDTQGFIITVEGANHPPVITSDPITVFSPAEGTQSNFRPGELFISSSLTDEIRVYSAETLEFIQGFTHPLFDVHGSPPFSFGPNGAAFNNRGNLVVATYSHFVEFSDYGAEYARYPKSVSEANETLIFDPLGNLYTTTATGGSNLLNQYRASDYSFQQSITLPPGAGQLTGITFDDQRRIYVGSQADAKIHVFSADETFSTFTYVNSFNAPAGGSLRVEGMQINRNGELVVACDDIFRYNPNTGTILGTFDAPFDNLPVPVTIDNLGRIYVADFENGSGTVGADIIRFSFDGSSFIYVNDAALFGPFGLVISGTSLPGGPSPRYVYDVDATDPDDGDVLTFSLYVAPAGMEIDPITGLIVWTSKDMQVGDHSVTVRVEDGAGFFDKQSFTVTVADVNERPAANAGSDQTAFVGDTVILDGSESSDVNGDPLTYQWSFTSIPAGSGATLSDPVAIDPTFEADLPGTYVVQLIVNDGTLDSDSDTVNITAVHVNSPPAITSAPVTTTTEDQLYTYDVEAEDPDIGDVLTFSLNASPAGMTIDAATGLVQWTPTSSQVGDNDVTVRVEDTGGLFDTQSFTVTVADVNDPPGITSIATTTATEGQPYSYDVDATDPDVGDVLTFSLDASPAGMTIDETTGLIQWTPTSSQVGDNDVTVRVEDTGGLFDTQSFVIHVQKGHIDDTVPPVVVVSASPEVVNIGDNTTISVTATDNVGVVSLELKIDGAPVSLDPSGEATFSSDTPGVFEAVADANDAAGNGFSDSVEIMVIDPGIGSTPTAEITAPAEDAVLQASVDVLGTASGSDFLNYKLHYAEHGTDDFVEFSEGTAPVTNDVLGAFDPTSLSNGLYTIRLTATTMGGNQAIASTIVEVDGNRKIGPFSVSFRDKVIPIGNFPLTVTRTYDSRNKTKGDFGIGWNLSLADAKLVENRIPGSDWVQTKSGGFLPTYTLSPTKSHTVTIRFGDDKKLKFRAQPNPQSQQLYQINYLNSMDYIPVGDTEGTLVPDVQPFFVMGGVGPVEFYASDLDLYNPGAFTYTAPDGFVYRFERSLLSSLRFKLTRITNPNGVTITLSADGILRSDGKNIGFTRDAEKRIIRLEDPKGNELNYEYNIRGDLAAFIDGEGNRSTFVYDADHNLLQIHDPLGRPIQRQEYDDDGRLIAITNGAGDRIVIEHDLSANREIVYDHRNNPTIYEYDGNGNVIRQTEFPTVNGAAQEVVTIRVYDADNQLISETKPNGSITTFAYSPEGKLLQKVIDAGTGRLNLTTTYTYDSSSRLLTAMDPRGNMVTNVYNGNGNLISRTDRADKTTTYQHNAGGQVTRETDPLGNYTVFTYDSFGNKTTEERFTSDGTRLGLVEFTYDDNGNKLTETIFVTIGGVPTQSTTSFEFDANDQLTAETDALGNRKQVEYNAVGQKNAEIDKRGHRTEFTYDERGNLTRIDHADGSATVYGYDADSNRNSVTDRNGYTTTFVFDALDRILLADFPDGSSRVKHYDAVGNMIAEIDELGNRTDHEYDAAGRRIRTLQPLVYDAVRDANIRPETLYEYDENGNRTAVVDANGNRTEVTYDKEDRKTKTTFPDTKEAIIVYNTIGQKIEQTDPRGLTTTYEYDALKRLVKVTLPSPGTGDPNPETLYEYNEAGNLIAQTDANGHITRFEYDVVGRSVARVLPAGQRETFNYDAEGNVVSHVDFNGDTVNSTYDADGRRTLNQYPDGSNVTTIYNGEDNRLQVTDTRGDTIFVYDSRNRLVEVTDPSGHKISYEYDGAGNTLSVTSPGGATNYTYDSLNRLATVTDTSAGVTTYRYDAVGNQAGITNANGTYTVYTYNSRNQLLNLENLKSDGTTVIDSYAYTLNANGLRTSIMEQDGSTVSYEYDDNYRLIREIRAGASPYDIQYSYDPVGNRISMNRDGVVTSYAYDANDRLQAAGGVIYSYDDNGNRITKTEGADTIAYEYDYENRLIRSVAPGGAVTGYSYDANGNRVRKQDGSGVIDYLVDIRSVTGVPQVVEERDGGDALQAMFVYGHDLLSQNNSGSLSYYHYDGLGSTRNLSDVSEAVTDSYTYDAYGREIASTGSTVNSYRFVGEQFDPNIGFYYLRARYYDQETGCFVSMDPMLGDPQSPISLHRYLYANDNPVNFVDPTGQFTLIEISITLAIQGCLRSIYIKHLCTFFLKAVQIAFCTLEPAYDLKWAALEMIMRGVPGGCDLYALANRMIAKGFQEIARQGVEVYQNIANDILQVDLKVEGLLVDFYNSLTSGEITLPVPEEVAKILELKNKIDNWLEELAKAYNNAETLITGGGDNCQQWKKISYFAEKAIAMIPKF